MPIQRVARSPCAPRALSWRVEQSTELWHRARHSCHKIIIIISSYYCHLLTFMWNVITKKNQEKRRHFLSRRIFRIPPSFILAFCSGRRVLWFCCIFGHSFYQHGFPKYLVFSPPKIWSGFQILVSLFYILICLKKGFVLGILQQDNINNLAWHYHFTHVDFFSSRRDSDLHYVCMYVYVPYTFMYYPAL
jgi:hypothetical protein